jgi:spermidine synthase
LTAYRAPSVFGGELCLTIEDSRATLVSNGIFLMSTDSARSERLLGTLAATAPIGARCLIGGLGLGVTLQAVSATPGVSAITVVEVEPAIVSWWSGVLQPKQIPSGGPLVDIVCTDLYDYLRMSDDTFDFICFDMDNGPGWVVDSSNERLYSADGLGLVRRRLAEDGVFAMWSAAASTRVAELMRAHFRDVTQVRVPVPRGEPDVIYIGWS